MADTRSSSQSSGSARSSARKSAASRSRKSARRAATAPVDGFGSPRLAESLAGLLQQASDELATANQLASALTHGCKELSEVMDAYTTSVQTLARLYRAAPDGPLAQFWAESLRPDLPEGIPELVAAANRAHRVRVV